MDRNRGFSFKLLVPSRVSNGQVSAVRPQEVEETCGDFMAAGLEKEQTMPFPNTSMVAPTKPTGTELPKIKAVSPMEKGENNCNPGQLYSKLFDEVEKVKCWKVKVDSDTLQKERRLQGNKRTIETQRKAIQELQRIILMILFALCVLSSQFGSESLSVKLEEQISENEDLRNNLRVKQKMINKRCKKALLQFEDLKEKYNQEYDMKEKEVSRRKCRSVYSVYETQGLWFGIRRSQSFKLKYGIRNMNYKTSCWTSMKTRSTANNSKKQQMNNVDFSVAQKLNKSPCFRNVSLRAALHRNRALAAILEQTKEEFTEMIQSKDSSLQGLRKVKNDQAETLEQIQTNIQELQDSLALETKSPHTTEAHLKTLTVRFCCSQDKTSKCVESMKEKSTSLKSNAAAGGKLFTEVKTNKEHTFQMEQLRQDIHQHEDKYTELLANFNELHCEKTVIQQQFVSRSSSVKAVEENLKDSEKKAVKLTKQIQRLEEENQGLREEVKSIENKSQEKCQETEILQKKLKQM
ncbi:hypothetical protein F7725_004972 [Dissostichus mawsoni]|uniref:Synaptonemal complex protein 1 n=1 Tax=Dissostichus mawsoni TaxID=36200 RepID=A0A7J5XMY1_DISMA|nr:hypothetical protein F7725_004972 [Dissostichus mawsoni]